MNTPALIQTILLVDDRAENLVALEAILEAPDRRLLKATSGNEALTIALKNDVSLVLLDVQMPDMNGFEVVELLRRNNKTRQVPVIFCSAANKEKGYMTRGFDVGAADYLFKPIDPDLLTAKVRVFLELDMQKRKLQQTLLQLHRVQQENERLLKAMGEGVLGIDKAGLVTFANPAAATLLGRETTRLIGEPIDELVFFDGAGRKLWAWAESPVLETVGRGMAFQSIEAHCLRDGKPQRLEYTVTPLSDRANGFSGAVAVLRDMEMRERAQTALQDRRASPRKRIAAGLTIFDRSTGTNVGQLVNISTGGLRLMGRKSFTDGQRIVFSMILPKIVNGNTTVSLNAVAIWISPPNFSGDIMAGFRFSDIKPESLEVIHFLMGDSMENS